jgi:single-strand DNA-binding protein
MAYLNQVQLIGNLGRTPELRYLPNGDAVINIGLATTKKYKDRDTSETKERTEWHSLVVYGGLAEIFAKYLKRGSEIYVAGELRTRKYTDKDNVDRYTTEIIVENMQMLGGRRDEQGHGAPGNGALAHSSQASGYDEMAADALPPAAGEEYPPAAEPAAAAPAAPAAGKGNGTRKGRSGNGK